VALALLDGVSAPPPEPAFPGDSRTLDAARASPSPAIEPGSELWLTYHRDTDRSGFDPWRGTYRDVQPLWASSTLDGKIYAEPLVSSHGLVVATEANSVYLLDLATGKQVWRTHIGMPVANSILPCGNVDPLGITGTPVIDAGTGLVYAVATLSQPTPHYLLFALDGATGALAWQRVLAPPGFDMLVENQRAALTLSAGMVYVAFGGRAPGDCGKYHGWLMASAADGTGPLLSHPLPTGRGGGLWAPSGPALDPLGNLVVTSGNSFGSGTYDQGNSVLRFSPSLGFLDSFAPANWSDLNDGDLDLGSTGPLMVGNGIAFQAGKEGTGYLVDTSHMGGVGGDLFHAKACYPAFGGNATANGYVYVPCTVAITALKLSLGGKPSFTTAWKGPHMNAAPPIVSGGAVWSVNLTTGHLVGLDPRTGDLKFTLDIGKAVTFTTPTASAGRLFVAATDVVRAFTG